MQAFSRRKLLVSASIAFLTLPAFSSLAFACMGCEMLKHPGCVVTFSPDGKFLASANSYKRTGQGLVYRKTFEIWQVPKLNLWKRLSEGQMVYTIAFSPDGKLLAIGGQNGFVSLWKLPEVKRLKRFKINRATIWHRLSNYIRSIAFSPDGKLLAAGTRNGEIYLWDLTKGRLVSVLSTNKGIGRTVASVAFSPDGKKLVALLEDGRLFQIWQFSKRQLLGEWEHNVNCFQVAFSADGRKIVGAGYSFIVCDASNGKAITKNHLTDYYSPPGGVSLDGRYVAMIAHSGTSVKVCRTSDLKEIWRKENHSLKLMLSLNRWAEGVEKRLGLPATKFFPYPKIPFAFSFAFSKDNRWLALGFDDGGIRIWRIK
ncbi:MAG: WD40 repeat domain-containing protein [Armatimonadetes bacterium]|nr:WD40 repeat domain-containing protein [Armatimonadota bacterium]MDW8027908.1 WD40 repeat domain-containing protein [Armatimonadota bacterium]